jgi:hypothetical protein
MRGISVLAGIAVLAAATTGAHADVTISNDTTENMTCAAGICAPTAADAVLNTSDLESLLASGAVTVTTTGSGVQAGNIVVQDAVTWTSTNALTLDAYQSITVNNPVSVDGVAGLNLATNESGNGGALTFGQQGHVVFSSLASSLAINGANYTLVGDIRTLAHDIAANQRGYFALAADYDASAEGTYNVTPIRDNFGGIFQGLGNAILNLRIHSFKGNGGLFAYIQTGEVDNLGMLNAVVIDRGAIGILAGLNEGTIRNSFATGAVTVEEKSAGFAAGALVGENVGVIENSYASGSIMSTNSEYGEVGGIAGYNTGEVNSCFSAVQIRSGKRTDPGGLVGRIVGSAGAATIENSYATGAVSGGNVGGVAGSSGSEAIIERSYSTGNVKGTSDVGGFVGGNYESTFGKDYWDKTTSGTDIGFGSGAAPGVKGLTTQQFQAGLPKGFSPKIWAENPKINGGLPYLIANPPPK